MVLRTVEAPCAQQMIVVDVNAADPDDCGDGGVAKQDGGGANQMAGCETRLVAWGTCLGFSGVLGVLCGGDDERPRRVRAWPCETSKTLRIYFVHTLQYTCT